MWTLGFAPPPTPSCNLLRQVPPRHSQVEGRQSARKQRQDCPCPWRALPAGRPERTPTRPRIVASPKEPSDDRVGRRPAPAAPAAGPSACGSFDTYLPSLPPHSIRRRWREPDMRPPPGTSQTCARGLLLRPDTADDVPARICCCHGQAGAGVMRRQPAAKPLSACLRNGRPPARPRPSSLRPPPPSSSS